MARNPTPKKTVETLRHGEAVADDVKLTLY